jgi:hypothetical protein
MAVTVPVVMSVIYAMVPAGFRVTSAGLEPAGTVATTVGGLVRRSSTDTVPSPELVT